MPYNWGEVLLVGFPQSGTAPPKKRPALVILDIGDADILLAPITTRERTGPGDVSISNWQVAGLLRPSWVRLAKASCLEKRVISRQLGRLTPADSELIRTQWDRLFASPSSPSRPPN